MGADEQMDCTFAKRGKNTHNLDEDITNPKHKQKLKIEMLKMKINK